MNINSFWFILFITAVIFIYFIFPKKYRWYILLISSYIFYWINSNILIIFILITTLSIYLLSLLLGKIDKNFDLKIKKIDKEEKKKLKNKVLKQKKLVVILTLIINLGILAVIKYFNFFAGNINCILNLFNINLDIPNVTFILPLGISYYTLQGLSYVIDVYRKKIEPEKNICKVGLFLVFFPQIVEGPIGRYKELSKQFFKENEFSYAKLKSGAMLILWGFFQKMVVADRLGIFVDSFFQNYEQYTGIIAIFAVLFYTFQIYADFAGCINIVRGVAEIFGIYLEENFKRPFFSKSIQEFWRRWNITLGVWLKEYIFYSIAFSKWCMKFTGYINTNMKKHKHIAKILPSLLALFFVWFANGLWHGASWKYVFYGMYYFIIMAVGMLLEPLFKKVIQILKINKDGKKYKIWQMLRTFIIVNIGMLIFRASNINVAFSIFKSIFNFSNINQIINGTLLKFGLGIGDFILIIISIAIILLVDYLQERKYHIREEIEKKSIYIRWPIYYLSIFSIIIFGIYGKDYNPSSFIYGQF